MPIIMILKLVRIGIQRRDRQPWEQPYGAGDLCLDHIAYVTVHMGVEIRTNRLMDRTYAQRLFVGQNGLIPERRVEKKGPWGRHTESSCEAWLLPHKVLGQLEAEPPGC